MKRLMLLVAVSLLVAAGCGGDDDDSSDEQTATTASPAQSCLDSWNAASNEAHQTTLATLVSSEIGLPGDKWRVGTWPDAERTVPVWSADEAFTADRPTGKAVVATDSCVIVAPAPEHATFFEAQGEWQNVRPDTGLKFPDDAWRSVADGEEASVDALGKLTLK